MEGLRDKTAIVGIGYSRDPDDPGAPTFTKVSGVSPLTLALRAAKEAALDAGIDPRIIDGGIMRHQDDSASPAEVLHALGSQNVAMSLEILPGNNYCVHDLQLAAQAVITGVCNCVLVYRSLNGSSGLRLGRFGIPASDRVGGASQFTSIYGLSGAPQIFAMTARRYMEIYGVTSRDLGSISVNSRRNAQANPRAVMRERPITIDDHQASRMIADPYHLFDCCLQTDGAAAVLVMAAERARDLRPPPVLIAGTAGSPRDPSDDIVDTPIKRYAPRLYDAAGISKDDIDLLALYDNFSDVPLRMIEDFGFCERGEARNFVQSEGIDLDGQLPIQTAGGLMSEGYAFHMNNLAEAVQQLRGEAEDFCPDWRNGNHTFDRSICRQVRRHDVAINTMGLGYGAVVLRKA